MNIDQENPQPPSRQGLSITEAAMRLGVSERTVYRMLREGKLRRLMSDNSGRSVRLSIESVDMDKIDSAVTGKKLSDNQSDITSVELLEALRQELREKDQQIAKLIEQQREMTAAMQRLQDQMFELARLTLSQNTYNGISSQGQSSLPVEPARKRRWWPWRQRGASS